MANIVKTDTQYFFAESNATLAVTTSSSSVNIGSSGDVVLIKNDGAATAYVAFGSSSATAVAGGVVTLASGTASMPVLSGEVTSIRGLVYDTAAAITDSGTTVLRFSRGSGV